MDYPYAVFAFDTYYPSGGIGDLKGLFATEKEAEACYRSCNNDHRQIVNLQNLAEERPELVGGL